MALQQEVNVLKEDLQAEKLKLKSQEDRVQHLEEELTMVSLLLHEY